MTALDPVTMRLRHWALAAWVVLAASVIGGTVVTGTLIGWVSDAVYARWPVNHDWRVSHIWREGDDLLLTGTIRKRWSCVYIPGPRAVSSKTGRHLQVESYSPTASQSWPADPELPRPFGPWRVRSGAVALPITVYQQHDCDGRLVFSTLGALTEEDIPPEAKKP